MTLKRDEVCAWLRAHGFREAPSGGHIQFTRDGVKVTVRGHGRRDLEKFHAAVIRRAIRRVGLELPDRL